MASTSLSCRTTGYACVSVRYRDTSYNGLKLFVMPNLCTDVLLGHDFLGLHGKVEISFGGDRDAFSICGLTAVNVESPSLFANLSPDCKPVATKSRRHHPDDEKFIRAEVDRLLQEGIIEPSTSPWRAQVLVTKNVNHKRRMVVDYSQTINRFTYLDAYPLPRLDKMIEEISHYEVYSTLDLLSAYHQVPISASDKPFTAFEACGGLFEFCRIPFGVTNGVACFQRTIDNIITTEKLKSTYAYIDNVTICGNTQDEHDLNLQSFLRATRKYGITLNDDKTVTASKVIRLLGYEVSKGVIRPDPERMEPIRQLPPPRTTTEMQRVIGMFAYYAHWISSVSDKINKLVRNKTFPLPADVKLAFDNLKNELENATLITIDYNEPLVVETDASDVAIAASLSQNHRPVAFFSRTLNSSEKNHSAIEKEAYAIVESIRKWRHYLLGRPFKLITDQRSVTFMYGGGQKGKVKNDKIQRWRIELSEYKYDVIYRPGKDNHVADTLSRNVCASMGNNNQLGELHNSLCHPGITRMFHFVRCKNLPYSVDDVKRVISSCKVCAELKPRFWKSSGKLIKATQPFERLSLDFKGPLPSNTHNRYLLTIIDEFSRFPFAFACADIT
ncbi:retrovirus-related Pol polyprotein from transposon opus [Clonorchis sinensis]|uniref:Retrovirus-related Pol polyprotein from transposon opus n=1 Tax=Clonorchis sinensis TaxID=79923 RepID=G7Y5V2_CLOSI|nr:retrovirus-related Pol polyprotein from transposon opus [Clonorchis sinensis]